MLSSASEDIVEPPKDACTIHYRVEYCVEWYYGILPETALPYEDQGDRIKAIAFHALCLAQNRTIIFRTIKSNTIGHYLEVSASIAINHKYLESLKDEYS